MKEKKEEKEEKSRESEWSTKPLRDYIDEKSRQVNTTQHDEGVRKSRLGRAKRAPTPFFSIFSHSLSFRRRIRPFTWFFFCNVDCYPSAFSPFRVERKKSWMSSFDFFDFQRMTHRSSWPESLLYTPAVHITTRNYLTRITLQTPGGDWRSTGGCELNGWWFIYVRCKFAGTCVFHRHNPMDCVRAFPTFDGCLVFLSSVGLLTCFVLYLKSRSLPSY